MAVVATLIACTVIAGAAVFGERITRQLASPRYLAESSAQVGEGVPSAKSETDFTRALPSADPHKPALLEIDRAAKAAGVAFLSSTIATPNAAAGQLLRTEITARLRGTYPALKQVIKEVLERFPQATVSRLRLSGGIGAAEGGAQLEAVWLLSLWSAPAGLEPMAAEAAASAARQ